MAGSASVLWFDGWTPRRCGINIDDT